MTWALARKAAPYVVMVLLLAAVLATLRASWSAHAASVTIAQHKSPPSPGGALMLCAAPLHLPKP